MVGLRQGVVRILCLHGKGSSSELMRSRMQPMIDWLGAKAEIQFMHAPHRITENPELAQWWILPAGERSFTASRYEGAEESISAVEKAIEEHKIHVLLGHSHGAMLAAVVLARRILKCSSAQEGWGEDMQQSSLRGAILSSPAWPNPLRGSIEDLKKLEPAASSLPLKIVCTIGARDEINPPSHTREILQCFQSALGKDAAVALEHGGGHVLPTDADSVALYDRHVFGGAERLIFGGSSLAGLYRPLSFEEGLECVEAALRCGMSGVDTAPHYGLGSAETVLSQALSKLGKLHDEDLKIFTKVGRRMIAPGASTEGLEVDASNTGTACVFAGADTQQTPVFDFSARGFELSWQDSLRRLDVPRVHGLRVHDCDTPERLAALRAGGGIAYLKSLRDRGEVKDISVGVNDASYALELMRDMPFLDSVLLANQWNLIDHPITSLKVKEECGKRGAVLHLAGVFASGILAGGSSHYMYSETVPEDVRKRVAAWSSLCAEHGLEMPAVALRFALDFCRDDDRVIVGLRTRKEVEEAAAWSRVQVPAALWAAAKDRGLLADHAHVSLIQS